MLDRIPERLRQSAEGAAAATKMMADAKSARNGDGACYQGLKREQTAEWQAAEFIEQAERALDVFAKATSLPGGPSLAMQRHDPTWKAWKSLCDVFAPLTNGQSDQEKA